VGGHIPFIDFPYFGQGGDYLPPVTGLDGVKSRYPIRNIFHISANNFLSGHFFKTERDTGNPQPI
jgi:hypothetical protein